MALAYCVLCNERALSLTAFRNVAILPSNERIHCVTPWRALRAARIPAKVFRAGHLRENVFRSGLIVRLLGEPVLARNTALGDVGLALVVAAVLLHAVG